MSHSFITSVPSSWAVRSCTPKQIDLTSVLLLCQCITCTMGTSRCKSGTCTMQRKCMPTQYKHYLVPPWSLSRKQIKIKLMLCKPLFIVHVRVKILFKLILQYKTKAPKVDMAHAQWDCINASLALPDRFFFFYIGMGKRVWWTAYTIFVLQIHSFCGSLNGRWLVSTKNKELFLQLSLAASFTPIYKSLLLSAAN